MIIAKWESRGGKHWAELVHTSHGYSYRSNNGGGSLGSHITADRQAIQVMQHRVDDGYFLPDDAKLPMRKTI